MAKLNLTQKLSVLATLRERTHDVAYQPGKITYEPGWSDQRIADEHGVQRKSVATIRYSEVGVLAEKSSTTRIKAERAESEPDIEAIIRDAVVKIVTPLSARTVERLGDLFDRLDALDTRTRNQSLANIEGMNKIIAAQEQLNIRVNNMSSEFGVHLAEINKRLGDRIDFLNQALSECIKELEARRSKPSLIAEAVREQATPKTLLADKLREAAARITNEA